MKGDLLAVRVGAGGFHSERGGTVSELASESSVRWELASEPSVRRVSRMVSPSAVEVRQ
jgi:hypothetical protein